MCREHPLDMTEAVFPMVRSNSNTKEHLPGLLGGQSGMWEVDDWYWYFSGISRTSSASLQPTLSLRPVVLQRMLLVRVLGIKVCKRRLGTDIACSSVNGSLVAVAKNSMSELKLRQVKHSTQCTASNG